MDWFRLLANLIVMSLANATVFLALVGPLLFSIVFERAQNRAKALVERGEESISLKFLAEAEEGTPAYSLMEYSLHYYTLIASMFGLVIGSWALVFIDLPQKTGGIIDSLGESPLHIRIFLTALVITLVALFVTLSAYCGHPKTVESYNVSDKDRIKLFGQALPPLNRITVFRGLSIFGGFYILWATIWIFGRAWI